MLRRALGDSKVLLAAVYVSVLLNLYSAFLCISSLGGI
jgi:hypothetical protein